MHKVLLPNRRRLAPITSDLPEPVQRTSPDEVLAVRPPEQKWYQWVGNPPIVLA